MAYSRTCKYSHCRNLVPVTQLYVSVDASTKESLKKIDRPLFRDFWPRFISSLEALSEKVHDVHIYTCTCDERQLPVTAVSHLPGVLCAHLISM